MPPKRGRKRKAVASGSDAHAVNGTAGLSPPTRDTWPGWVEMESEPAFFNVMLKEMGVRGVKIQEVYSMDPEFLAFVPQPIHALIFLFRYRSADQEEQENPPDSDHIWFANQIPDFACATVALLNIVYNIRGLEMGKELREFRDFTKDLDPISRGDMIDNFDFAKHIHNSFARENDLLNADLHTKGKVDKAKKKVATAKARATKEAKKAGETPLKESSSNAVKPVRASTRTRESAVEDGDSVTRSSQSRRSSTRSTRSSHDAEDIKEDDAFEPMKKVSGKTKANCVREPETGVRRSTRKPKPRVNRTTVDAKEAEAEEGFHFIAYMPIRGHVWKLDGLDWHPTDVGPYGASETGADIGAGDWIDVVTPTIMERMSQFAGEDIQFNMMAVVHDPAVREKEDLLQSVKLIQLLDTKLYDIAEDWRDMEGAETKRDVITGPSKEFGIAQEDIDGVQLSVEVAAEVATQEDFLGLTKLRQRIISRQTELRSGLRDALRGSREDDEKARHRRHDYGSFVRGWVGTLAEQELLGDLVDDA